MTKNKWFIELTKKEFKKSFKKEVKGLYYCNNNWLTKEKSWYLINWINEAKIFKSIIIKIKEK